MLRLNLLRNFRIFQGTNVAAASTQLHRLNCHSVRIVSSSENKISTSLGNEVFPFIPVVCVRNFHVASRTNGRLLQMFEDLQKRKTSKSKQEQLLSSFNMVRKIQMETDPEELLEIYNAIKDETRIDQDNLAVLYAQVALLYRFAYLAARQTGHRFTSNDDVMNATVNLANIIRWNSNLCEPTHLASAVYSIASLGFKDLSYFIHFEREIRSCTPSRFTNPDLAMILWAYGKVQFRSKQVYKFIRNEIMARDLSTFKVKEICQFLWSYARTLEKGAKLFAALREEIMKRDLTQFEERSLTIILWSYSEVGLNVKPLFRSIKLEILRRGVASFTYQQLAQIASSYAQQNIRSPDLYQEISAELIERGELNFAPVGLVMVVNGFAKTKNYIRDLFKLIENHLLAQDLSVYEPLQVVRLLWAFTDAGLLTEPLFRKLTDEILDSDFSNLNDLCLEELVKALETCRFHSPELVQATEAELVRRSEVPE